MSLSTVLEAVHHEGDSMQPDEWLDFLVQLRDEIQRCIDREIYRQNSELRPSRDPGGSNDKR